MFRGSLSFWLGEDHWGKGLATQAVRLLLNELYADKHLKRLQASVAHENRASIAVLTHAGFVQEAVFKNNLFLRGRFFDELVFSFYFNTNQENVDE